MAIRTYVAGIALNFRDFKDFAAHIEKMRGQVLQQQTTTTTIKEIRYLAGQAKAYENVIDLLNRARVVEQDGEDHQEQ